MVAAQRDRNSGYVPMFKIGGDQHVSYLRVGSGVPGSPAAEFHTSEGGDRRLAQVNHAYLRHAFTQAGIRVAETNEWFICINPDQLKQAMDVLQWPQDVQGVVMNGLNIVSDHHAACEEAYRRREKLPWNKRQTVQEPSWVHAYQNL